MDAHKTKITVVKVFKPGEIFGDNPPATLKTNKPCSKNKEGDEFSISAPAARRPEGFCETAWAQIRPYVLTIHYGGNISSWIEEPGTAVVPCADGFRPVIFKIQRVE